MKLLLHTCCAPCSVYCIKSLRQEGIEPTIYWFNPNIHPYAEYKLRRDTLKEYTKNININTIIEEKYGLKEFCKNVIDDLNNRCVNYCYRVRLEQTAKYAKENGYDTFSTTLLISPYQNHNAIKELGEEIGKKYQLKFLYRDFRIGFKEGQQEARERGLYMQKYCGCIFSLDINFTKERENTDIKVAELHNKEIERKIRLGRDVPDLEIRYYKNGNQEEMQFIYNLKKEEYEKQNKKWDEQNQKKLLSKFMKENSKHIQLIYLKNELIGFFNEKDIIKDSNFETSNIYIKSEYRNKGIENSILKEMSFEFTKKEIVLK